MGELVDGPWKKKIETSVPTPQVDKQMRESPPTKIHDIAAMTGDQDEISPQRPDAIVADEPLDIAKEIVARFKDDPVATRGVEYRLPATTEGLAEHLRNFKREPARYSRRFMYLVAMAYQSI